MTIKRITISLETKKDGRVPVHSFRIALDDLVGILNDVGLELSEHKRTKLSWDIAELSLSSATIGLESTYEDDVVLIDKTISTVIAGLKILNKKQVRPKYFNNDALEKTKQLAKIVSDKIPCINIYADAKELQSIVTESIITNVKAILEHIEFIGSIEGFLELLAGPEGEAPYFRIRDVITGAKVMCSIPENMLNEALKAFRKRVLISGLIQYDNEGKPRTIKVKSIETIPIEENLPQPKDVRGIMKDQIGDSPSEDYLKEHFSNG
jgi:hypothetical protein